MPGDKKLPLADEIIRLRRIDRLLRDGGLNVKVQASDMGVDARTIRRMIAILQDLVGPTKVEKFDFDDGSRYLHKYSGRPKQLFAKFRE